MFHNVFSFLGIKYADGITTITDGNGDAIRCFF
jgi:hypothetical protein